MKITREELPELFKMVAKIKLTEEQKQLFQGGNVFHTEKDVWYNFPYWIKESKDTGEFTIYSQDDLIIKFKNED